jgi:uncharacterized repeat protein (TIGR02059 family)
MAKARIKFKNNYTGGDAPVIYKIGTSADGELIEVELLEDMASPAGKHGQFSLSVNGSPVAITAAALKSGDDKIIQLTADTPIEQGDEVLLTYSGDILSASGGYMQPFAGVTVLNYVGSSIPFFNRWGLIIDATNAGNIEVDGSNNITRIFSSAAPYRYFVPQSTGYATYDAGNGLINVIFNSTNEYVSDTQQERPAKAPFCFAVRYKAPQSEDTGQDQDIWLMRHSTEGDALRLPYNATPSKRNIVMFTNGEWFRNDGLTTSPIANDGNLYNIIVTYNGTTLKIFIDGTQYSAQAVVTFNDNINKFNRLFQSNGTNRSPYGLKWLGLGEYIDDSEVATLNTYLNGL